MASLLEVLTKPLREAVGYLKKSKNICKKNWLAMLNVRELKKHLMNKICVQAIQKLRLLDLVA